MQKNDIDVFYPKSQTAWRKWLEKNHLSKQAVWLVFYTKSSGKTSISWSEAVDVALCFGWIDSKKVKIDTDTAHQFFSKRKPKSTWSRINKNKIEKLTEQGLMSEAGLASIAIAKQNGSWTMLDDVEDLVIPPDLERALLKKRGIKEHFLGLSKSAKKLHLSGLVFAKTAQTRQKRIDEIVSRVEENLKEQKAK